MNSGLWLSIVVPVYNEEKNIRETVRKISAFMALKGRSWELLVINDGSKDGTQAILSEIAASQPELPLKVLRSWPNHGKGYAARQGMLAAAGQYVLLTDADMSSPIKEVDKLVAAMEKGADIAIGSRALRAKDCDVRQSFKRSLSGRIFNFFVQCFVLPGIQDSQCGFKSFKNAAAKALFSRQKLDGFSFDVEVLYLARKSGYNIAEVPVMWSQGLHSHVSLIRDPLRMLKDLFKIKSLHA